MFEAALEGLMAVIRWSAIGYLVLGVLVGLSFGAAGFLMPATWFIGQRVALPFFRSFYSSVKKIQIAFLRSRRNQFIQNSFMKRPARILQMGRRLLIVSNDVEW